MWSSRSPAPLSCELRPSRLLLLLLGGSHALALIALLLAELPAGLRPALAVAVLISLVCTVLRHHPHSPWGVCRVDCAPDGGFDLIRADGRRLPGRLVGAYIHTHLVLLNLATGRWARRTVVIFRDGCAAAQHRRLRVRLTTWRWGDEEEDS